MITYQDFERASNKPEFIMSTIREYTKSEMYTTAELANKYDHQKNETITQYVKTIFSLTGTPIEDFTASNNKLCSNFFHRLNTQRCNYLLGNGVQFTKHVREDVQEDGSVINTDETKEALGNSFDNTIKKLGYNALIHGVSYGFWNVDKLYSFTALEFVPLLDEETGILRAGIRFWQLDDLKPMSIVFYEEDGYTKYLVTKGKIEEVQAKKSYVTKYAYTEVDGDIIVGEENYTMLPIIPFYGSSLKQSTLIGMREKIDSYDLIRSGFANDLTDCAEIYWIIENHGGMTDADLAQFRDRLKINHIVTADTDHGAVRPYTQDIPFQARQTYLNGIRSGIYEDFGGLDVHVIAAGSTNDHIDAAYQPLDEEADDFEYQVIDFITQLLDLIGIDDIPTFKRNRISNHAEQTQLVLSAADYLDTKTILDKLPFITVDEVARIMASKQKEDMEKMQGEAFLDTSDDEEAF